MMSTPATGSRCSSPVVADLPLELQEQFEKLSSDLVDSYEALTLVYRTVSSLGSLFRVNDITNHLLSRALEAVLATRGTLFLRHADGSFEVASEQGDLASALDSDSLNTLCELGKPMFFHGVHAHRFWKNGSTPLDNLISAPLETGGRTLGVLVLARDSDRSFTTVDTNLVAALCGLAAVSVANFQHYQAVSYEREMLEGVVGEIGDGIVVLDRKWNSRLTNGAARRYLGVADDEGEGYDVLARLDAFKLSATPSSLRDGHVEPQEFRAESRDLRRPLVLQAKVFGARVGTDAESIQVLCLRDVTREHREAEAQRDFLSTASHKLRTPLTKILGLLPLARDAGVDSNMRDEAFDGIGSGAEELRHLVDGVLQFVEFRQGDRVSRPVNLVELLDEAATTMSARHQPRGIHIKREVLGDVAPIVGSRKMLSTMFEHLLDNAVKFSQGARPFVQVSLSYMEAGHVTLKVEDRGEGMSPEFLQRLFQPFSQRDEEFTGQSSGAGLGLMLVQQAVESHGGKISVDSKLGQGTVFRAQLPLHGVPGESGHAS